MGAQNHKKKFDGNDRHGEFFFVLYHVINEIETQYDTPALNFLFYLLVPWPKIWFVGYSFDCFLENSNLQ